MADINTGNMSHSIVKSFDESTDSLKTTLVNAAVDVTVSAFTDSIAIADASGNKATTTVVGAKRGLDVNVVDVTLDAANDSIAIKNGANTLAINADGSINVVGGSGGGSGLTDTQLRASAVPVSLTSTTISNFPATQAISAASLPLPSGASTSALQTTANSSLSSIDTKTPSLGQALAAASTPVVLTAAQMTTLTPLSSVSVSNFPASQAVTGTFFQGTQPVSIAASVAVTGPLTDTQIRATALPVSGTVSVTGVATETTLSALNTKVPSGLTVTANRLQVELPAGGSGLTNTELRASAVPVSGTFFQATQPISAVSLPLPSGAATETTTSAINTKIPSGLTVTSNRLQVELPAGGSGLTNTELRASAVPVSLASTTITNFPATQAVSGTFFQATQPVSIAATVAVSGPLTDTQIRATALPVSGTVSANATLTAETTKVIGTVNIASAQSVTANAGTNLNTSALALETTQVSMSAKLPATLGQKTMAASMSVSIASDQTTIPVSFAAASTLFKGRASTFRTPGRAGTVGQKILSLHNATGSTVTVSVNKVVVDLACTVVKAITVLPPLIRLYKVTVLPTSGTSITKNKIGGTSTSNASVTVLNDASADGTNSATALTATLPAGAIITQEFAPRFITAAGYEPADRMEFLGDTSVSLGPLEGVVLFVEYVLATQNPVTDMWAASIEWTES